MLGDVGDDAVRRQGVAVEVHHELAQGSDGQHFYAADQGGFGRVLDGHVNALDVALLRHRYHRQDAHRVAHRPSRPSSPRKTVSLMSPVIWSVAARRPRAMGRS